MNLAYTNADYDRSAADTVNGGGAVKFRNDDLFNVLLAVKYDIQNWLQAKLAYTYVDNSTNFQDRGYSQDTVALSINGAF